MGEEIIKIKNNENVNNSNNGINTNGIILMNHFNNYRPNVESSQFEHGGYEVANSASLVRYDNHPLIRNQDQIVVINQ